MASQREGWGREGEGGIKDEKPGGTYVVWGGGRGGDRNGCLVVVMVVVGGCRG